MADNYLDQIFPLAKTLSKTTIDDPIADAAAKAVYRRTFRERERLYPEGIGNSAYAGEICKKAFERVSLAKDYESNYFETIDRAFSKNALTVAIICGGSALVQDKDNHRNDFNELLKIDRNLIKDATKIWSESDAVITDCLRRDKPKATHTEHTICGEAFFCGSVFVLQAVQDHYQATQLQDTSKNPKAIYENARIATEVIAPLVRTFCDSTHEISRDILRESQLMGQKINRQLREHGLLSLPEGPRISF